MCKRRGAKVNGWVGRRAATCRELIEGGEGREVRALASQRPVSKGLYPQRNYYP